LIEGVPGDLTGNPLKLWVDKICAMSIYKLLLLVLVLPLAFTSLACPTRTKDIPDASPEGQGGKAGGATDGGGGGAAGAGATGPGGAAGHANGGAEVSASSDAGAAGAGGLSGGASGAGGMAGRQGMGGSASGAGGGGTTGAARMTGGTNGAAGGGGKAGVAGMTGGGGAIGGAGGAGGVAASCVPACTPPTGGTSTCVKGSCVAACTVTGQVLCGTVCVDKNSDKQNCGGCGTMCETYQYCRSAKCSPTYEWTRVLPVNPLDASYGVHGAAVTSTDDIIVQVDLNGGSAPTTLTFSNPQETNTQVTTTNQTVAIGRVSSTNHLTYGQDLAYSFLGQSSGIQPLSVSPLVVTANDDVVVGGVDAVTTATGTVVNSNVLIRLDSANSLNRDWAAAYSNGANALSIFPRPSRADYITLGQPPDEFHGVTGQVARVLEAATTATNIAPYLANAAALGADKTTLWFIGTGNGPTALNPWSPTMTNLSTSAQSYIIGAKDDGSSFGPWLTSGAPANLFKIAVDPNSDLIVVAGQGGRGTTGAVTLNGQEILGAQDVVTIFKVRAANGSVVWKVPVPSSAFVPVTVGPDGAAIFVSPAASTYALTMFADADGTIPASFTGSGTAQLVASGSKSLYILGAVRGSADFNPGSKSDIQGNLPGIFITRFSY
jgi:hypothetical protein